MQQYTHTNLCRNHVFAVSLSTMSKSTTKTQNGLWSVSEKLLLHQYSHLIIILAGRTVCVNTHICIYRLNLQSCRLQNAKRGFVCRVFTQQRSVQSRHVLWHRQWKHKYCVEWLQPAPTVVSKNILICNWWKFREVMGQIHLHPALYLNHPN